eukprot:TRINITY_DN25167_c0_g1_i1.p1 TRINITY_DN25167_c0_g1~~TRINITY_DN25167_c0_g1_i1.p1  ORF type:complete len:671 (+),score=198.04 TRINITY_DN25167_c0_g1_i1:84-2096(+)
MLLLPEWPPPGGTLVKAGSSAAAAAVLLCCCAHQRQRRRLKRKYADTSRYKVDLDGLLQALEQCDGDGDGRLTHQEFVRFVSTSFGFGSQSSGGGADFADLLWCAFGGKRAGPGQSQHADGADDLLEIRSIAAGLAVMASGSADERIELAFRFYDLDGDGMLGVAEVTSVVRTTLRVLAELGLPMPRDETLEHAAERLFQRMAPDGAGLVSRQQFCSVLRREPEYFQLFGLGAAAAGRRSRTVNRNTLGRRLLWGEPSHNFALTVMLGIRSVMQMDVGDAHRPLAPADYTEVREVRIGDKPVISYAPRVFRGARLRDGISDRRLCVSLGVCGFVGNMLVGNLATLSAAGNAGARSGAEFFQSYDGAFLLKCIGAGEMRTLLDILPRYDSYMAAHPSSLINRYYGLFSVKDDGVWRHVLVMSHLFPSWCEIHHRYDLKGADYNRRRMPEGATPDSYNGLLCDGDVAAAGTHFSVGPLRGAIVEQIRQLGEWGVYDYSLLVGVHHAPDGEPPIVIRTRSWSHPLGRWAHSPVTPPLARHSSCPMLRPSGTARPRHSGPGDSPALGRPPPAGGLPPRDDSLAVLRDAVLPRDLSSGERLDAGDADERLDHAALPNGDHIFLGIIDILTPYTARRQAERLLKRAMCLDRQEVSACPPAAYAERFWRKMDSLLVE